MNQAIQGLNSKKYNNTNNNNYSYYYYLDSL